MATATVIATAKLSAMLAEVQASLSEREHDVPSNTVPESERLKRINDEKAAQRAVLKAQLMAKRQAALASQAREEAERVEIDKKEAQIREDERKKTVAEAEKKLWEQTEDVRKLQAAMILSDVLAERQGQLQSQQLAKDLRTKANQQFHASMLANLKNEEAAAEKKRLTAQAKAQELRSMQDQQLEEVKQTILHEREERRKEGLQIKADAFEAADEASREALLRRLKAVESELATRDANLELKQYREKEREKDRLSDIKIAEHAAKQQAVQEARQSAQLAKLKEKEAKRAAITQKMEQVFNEAQQKRDAMESSNKAEFEERAAEDAAQRQLQREEMWRAIDKSRKQQIEERETSKAAEKAAESSASKVLSQVVAFQQAQEVLKTKASREKHQKYTAFLDRQIGLSENARQEDLAYAMEEDALRLLGMAARGAAFDKYAAAQLRKWEGLGKDTKPLKLVLAAPKNDLKPAI